MLLLELGSFSFSHTSNGYLAILTPNGKVVISKIDRDTAAEIMCYGQLELSLSYIMNNTLKVHHICPQCNKIAIQEYMIFLDGKVILLNCDYKNVEVDAHITVCGYCLEDELIMSGENPYGIRCKGKCNCGYEGIVWMNDGKLYCSKCWDKLVCNCPKCRIVHYEGG